MTLHESSSSDSLVVRSGTCAATAGISLAFAVSVCFVANARSDFYDHQLSRKRDSATTLHATDPQTPTLTLRTAHRTGWAAVALRTVNAHATNVCRAYSTILVNVKCQRQSVISRKLMPPLLDKENVKMTDCTDCNVFQFCQFLKLLGKIMILLVLLIVGLTYYAVIIVTSVPGLYEDGARMKTWSLFVIIAFHCLVSFA